LQDFRPRVLYLVHRVPYPPNRGDRIRSFHLLRSLAARTEVHLAFLAQERPPRETMSVLEGFCKRVAPVQLGRRNRWARAAWSLAVGRTATEGLFQSRKLQSIIRNWTCDTRFDSVVVFCSSMMQYVDAPGLLGVPVIVDLVDVDSQKWFDYAESSAGLKRCLFRLEGRRLRRLEGCLSERAEAITLVSPSEADLCRKFCPTDRIHVVPNGVDLDYFNPAQASDSRASQRCVFVGALDYRANIDGIRWFSTQIWPEIRRLRPRATFTLVGSKPTAAVCRLAELPGVELAGDVPDVRPYLADAAVVVVPLRIARGLQNKVLEALAMAKAVIATPQALKGLDATPDVHLCQASTSLEWIEATTNLLDAPDLRGRLGLAGRAYVERKFQWKTQLEPLVNLPGLCGSRQQADAKTDKQMAV